MENKTSHRCKTKVKAYQVEFTWTIDNFSLANDNPGDCLKSTIFSTGGNSNIKWRLLLYPNGYKNVTTGHISILIQLVASDKPNVKADCWMCLIDKHNRNKNIVETTKVKMITGYNMVFQKFIKLNYVLDDYNQLLDNDRLCVYCFIRCSTGVVRTYEDIEDIEPNQLFYEEMSEAMEQLLNYQNFSDVVLCTDDDTEFCAHKNILAARSPVFAAMFKRKKRNRKSNFVLLPDITSNTLSAMLRFIYTGKLIRKKPRAIVKLLQASEKYSVSGLKIVCEQVLCKSISVENAADYLIAAELSNSPKLKTVALDFIKENLKFVIGTAGYKSLRKQPLLFEEILINIAKIQVASNDVYD